MFTKRNKFMKKYISKKPLVSVVMPVYNAEKYLQQAIESIMFQNYINWELIIVDDGSIDNSLYIARNFSKKDKRIKIFRNIHNLGIGETMNKLLSLTKGDFIARMDADDISLPDRLEKEANFLMKNKDIALVGGYMFEIDKNDYLVSKRTVPIKHGEIVSGLITGQTIQNPTLMFVKSRLPKKELHYNGKLSPVDDLDFLFRVSGQVKLANLAEFLVVYRKHDTNSSLKDIKKTFALTWQVRKIAQKHYGYKPRLSKFLIHLLQGIIVFLIPNKLLYGLFKIWKKNMILSRNRKYNGYMFVWDYNSKLTPYLFVEVPAI